MPATIVSRAVSGSTPSPLATVAATPCSPSHRSVPTGPGDTAVDADAVRSELLRERLGEVDQGGLGGAVVDRPPVGMVEGVDRGDVDHRSRPWPTIAPSAARVARSAMKKFICIAHSNSSSPVARNPSRRMRAAPTLLTSTSTPPCSSTARLMRAAGASGGLRSSATGDDAHQAIQLLGRARSGDHEGALPAKRSRDRKPDAVTGAGHNRDFVCQVQIHCITVGLARHPVAYVT